jgi:phospholipid/cholesterol/gamma-HCH transport system permease protein
LRLKGGAEEVGRITTLSVVISFFLIILADTVFSVLFSYLGL